MRVFAAVMKNLHAKLLPSLVHPLAATAQCTTSPIAPNRLPKPPIRKHFIMKTFVRSPLAVSALTAVEVDAIDTVYGDALVQRVAGQLQLRRAHLLEIAGYRSAIAEAIAAAGEPVSVTPDQVAATLNRLADEVDEEIAAVGEDHALHDAHHKARLERTAPLKREVSARLTALIAEQAHCLIRIDAARRASTMGGGAGTMRHASLVAAGLTTEQINSLGPAAQSPADQEDAMKTRMAAIAAEMAPLRDFGATGDVAHLNGVVGLDSLITQAFPWRVVAEVAAA